MDESDILWIPNNNYFPGRSSHKPHWLIIHGTAGFTSAEEVAYFFKATEGTENPVSTHYIIGLRGEVVQCIDEENSAWANGGVSGSPDGTSGDGVHRDSWWTRALNPNYVTISIEHVKLSRDNSDELTEMQKEASFRLVRSICNRHMIPKRWADQHGGITGHYSMDPINRYFCPGPYPWEELFAYLCAGI
jgi:N-acetyl-anhydromuramyl-L-alanine amidase AmpD